jgi:hypothetical protein
MKMTGEKQQCLEKAVAANDSLPILFAIELYDLKRANALQIYDCYRIPTNFRELSLMVIDYFPLFSDENIGSNPKSILELFLKTDAFRRGKRFQEFLTTCEYLQLNGKKISCKLQLILNELQSIDNTQFVEKGLVGKEFANALKVARIARINKFISKPL